MGLSEAFPFTEHVMSLILPHLITEISRALGWHFQQILAWRSKSQIWLRMDGRGSYSTWVFEAVRRV
jgi:hypothetical protein